MSILLAVLLAVAAPVAPAPAASATPPAAAVGDLLSRLLGVWAGTGLVVKRESQIELRVERLWERPLFRLSWRNRMGGPTPDVFEGLAVYEQHEDGRYTARWWDSGGGRHTIEPSAQGSALTALWGASGRTVYTLLESGELEVVDSVKRKDGSWGEFGRSLLKRRSAPRE